MKTQIVYGVIAIVLCFGGARAQSTVQVLTKTVEKEFAYSKGDLIKVIGEKSTITVKTWEKPTVKVTLKLISKALTREVASNELTHLKYIMENSKEGIGLKNYVLLPKGKKKIEAILLTEYMVWIPRKAKLHIENSYGNTAVEQLTGDLFIDSKFGNIMVEDIEGMASYKSYYGELLMRSSKGNIFCDLTSTKTKIENVSGTITIAAELSDIEITPDKLIALKVNSAKGDVKLTVRPTEMFNFGFNVSMGEIIVPHVMQNGFSKNQKAWHYGKPEAPTVKIVNTLGKIIVENK